MARRFEEKWRRLWFERLEDRSALAGDAVGWGEGNEPRAAIGAGRFDNTTYEREMRADAFFSALGDNKAALDGKF